MIQRPLCVLRMGSSKVMEGGRGEQNKDPLNQLSAEGYDVQLDRKAVTVTPTEKSRQ